jgi:hypothetical protein
VASGELSAAIAYRNGAPIGIPRVETRMHDGKRAPVLPVGYVVNASRIAGRRIMLAGYRLVDLFMRLTQN